MTKLVKLLVIPLIISFALISCNTTSPNKVKKSDAQKRVEQKRRDYNKLRPAEKKKLQDADDARRKAFEKTRKKKGN